MAALFITGTGTIYAEVMLIVTPENGSQNGKKPEVVFYKGVTFNVLPLSQAELAKLMADRNAKKLKDTETILKILQEYVSSGGKLPTSITNSPKEMCGAWDPSCVDLSMLNHKWVVPSEPGWGNHKGNAYLISRSGNLFTVKAKYPEGGQVIQSSAIIK